MGIGQGSVLRFIDQQMNMCGHDHVSVDTHGELAAHVLQTLNEQVARVWGDQVGLSAVATESEEMGLPGLLEASQTGGHKRTLGPFLWSTVGPG
jgi:hypothetical protein